MSRKLKMILLGVGIIFIVLMVVLFQLSRKVSNRDNQTKLVDTILESVSKKEELLVFVTNSEKQCYLCPDAGTMIDFYEKQYRLKFTAFDKSKNAEKDFSKLKKELGIQDSDIKEPAVIMIKDGNVLSIVNEIVTEELLRKFLIEHQFMKDDFGTDTQISLEDFKTKLASNDKSLIALISYTEISQKNREILLALSKEYHFRYDIAYSGISEGAMISSILREKIKDNLTIPLIAVVQNNEVIDHITTSDEKKLISFLKKNGFIEK